MSRPILAVDVDGVISPVRLRGAARRAREARFELVDGMVHCISLPAGERLLRLAEHFELVWATRLGGQSELLPAQLLGLPELPHVCLRRRRPLRLRALEAGAARGVRRRPGARLDRRQLRRELLRVGASARPEPTLLVPTEPHLGLEEAHVEALNAWAAVCSEPRRTGYTDPVTGFWPIFFLLVVLRSRSLGSLWLVWWASQAARRAGGGDRRGRRRLQARGRGRSCPAARAAARTAAAPRVPAARLPAGRAHPGRQAGCAARFRSRRISRR